jgi:hypothetical protein
VSFLKGDFKITRQPPEFCSGSELTAICWSGMPASLSKLARSRLFLARLYAFADSLKRPFPEDFIQFIVIEDYWLNFSPNFLVEPFSIKTRPAMVRLCCTKLKNQIIVQARCTELW